MSGTLSLTTPQFAEALLPAEAAVLDNRDFGDEEKKIDEGYGGGFDYIHFDWHHVVAGRYGRPNQRNVKD